MTVFERLLAEVEGAIVGSTLESGTALRRGSRGGSAVARYREAECKCTGLTAVLGGVCDGCMASSASFAALAAAWHDDPVTHQRVFDAFAARVEATPWLREHRDHVERHQLGFGYRAFHWFWKLVADDVPDGGRFLEVGVWKGQSVVAPGLCLARVGKRGEVYGLSTYDGKILLGTPADLFSVVAEHWNAFLLDSSDVQFFPLFADSQTDAGRAVAEAHAPYDAVYVDGDHGYRECLHDLKTYGGMVRPGGLLIADDAAFGLNIPADWFKGFEGSSRACDDLLPPKTANPEWAHIGSLGHLRVWRRVGGQTSEG